MSTPIVTSHRNLHQRIRKILGTKGMTAWQLERVGDALDDLEFGRYPEGEHLMSMVERPDLYEPVPYKAGPAVKIEDLHQRLGELGTPKG